MAEFVELRESDHQDGFGVFSSPMIHHVLRTRGKWRSQRVSDADHPRFDSDRHQQPIGPGIWTCCCFRSSCFTSRGRPYRPPARRLSVFLFGPAETLARLENLEGSWRPIRESRTSPEFQSACTSVAVPRVFLREAAVGVAALEVLCKPRQKAPYQGNSHPAADVRNRWRLKGAPRSPNRIVRCAVPKRAGAEPSG